MSLADARAYDHALASRPLRPKPGPDARAVIRRMAGIITQHLTMAGNVTARDLESAGFSRVEIADHFTAAVRRARAAELAG